MLGLRGVPAHQAVLPECPDVPDSRDGILPASQGCRPGPSGRPLPPAAIRRRTRRCPGRSARRARQAGGRCPRTLVRTVRLSMTRNARAWRAEDGDHRRAAVNPSEMAGRVNGSAVLRCAPALRVTLARLAAAQSALNGRQVLSPS